MKGTVLAGQIVAIVAVVLLAICGRTVAEDKSVAESIEKSRVAWNKFLADNCPSDMTEQAVRKLMDGKYRDIGFAVRANSETYTLLFLLDDFHQVEFGFFAKTSKLILTPRIEPKGQWLRMPSGAIQSIPDPAEVRLKSKVAEAAIDHIVKHTNRKTDSLEVSCQRSDKAGTWDVVVAVKTLQVDPPAWLLQVTEDGQVTERTKVAK
jgi:hypothetical protein